MRKIAIGLATLTIATAASTLTAPAIPGGGSLVIKQSVGHADINNNVDQVTWRRARWGRWGRWGGRGVIVHRRFGPAWGRAAIIRRW